MTITDQTATMLSLARTLYDFAATHAGKLDGFHASHISPETQKPGVFRFVETLADAKMACLAFEPDTSKWLFEHAPRSRFTTERMGVTVEIIANERAVPAPAFP